MLSEIAGVVKEKGTFHVSDVHDEKVAVEAGASIKRSGPPERVEGLAMAWLGCDAAVAKASGLDAATQPVLFRLLGGSSESSGGTLADARRAHWPHRHEAGKSLGSLATSFINAATPSQRRPQS